MFQTYLITVLFFYCHCSPAEMVKTLSWWRMDLFLKNAQVVFVQWSRDLFTL